MVFNENLCRVTVGIGLCNDLQAEYFEKFIAPGIMALLEKHRAKMELLGICE